MPAPERKLITFEIDGREVTAPEGSMLVDAAKLGDVEIPVFCYEPKLGAPVGACRMCLVEVEGIPKLQAGCATPVKDGMVVSTVSPEVRDAQRAVVEFLLVNHPLDCPVCDKGGECPLQDITMGWGPGRSRFVEPKRHFEKPLYLSPLVAIDRERCILCYRCVRFSQEVSEDYQLVFLERGSDTFVGTHDSRPYVGPFSGNIIELCPVGALTSTAYRFRARPWDIEQAGSVCTLCPSQCNVSYTVRDEQVERVLCRDHEGVDDGWLCDKGRFAYQATRADARITKPLLREGGSLRPVSWERAYGAAADGLRKAGERTAALTGGGTTNEEAYLLQRIVREALGSPHVDSRVAGPLPAPHARALAQPALSAAVTDIDWAGTILVLEAEPLDEAPILDLRIRKARRRNGAKLVVVTSRPSALDRGADAVVRFAPGAGEAAVAALAAALAGGDGLEDSAGRAGADAEALRGAARLLRGGDCVVLHGERLATGERGPQALARLLRLADALGLASQAGGGLIEVPANANGRGLREAGCLPACGPGLTDTAAEGLAAAGIAGALGGDVTALVLLDCDPLRTHPDRAAWERGLGAAGLVVAFAEYESEGLAEYADVVFPLPSNAEREGTVTHPDGRVQRVRQAVRLPDEVRPAWAVLAALLAELGGDAPASLPEAFAQLVAAAPVLGALTLDDVGARGVRWPEGDGASALGEAEPPVPDGDPPPLPELGGGRLRLGAAPTLWSGPETAHGGTLSFLVPRQTAELSAADARRIGVRPGDEVVVSSNGTSVRATAALREAVAEGTVFMTRGTAEDNANALENGSGAQVEVRPA